VKWFNNGNLISEKKDEWSDYSHFAPYTGNGPTQYLRSPPNGGFSDHLGSTALVTNGTMNRISEIRYNPWGSVRAVIGAAPADNAYTYTGQRHEAYINLLWYGSRWYDPLLGRLLSPDSIVPGLIGRNNPNAIDYKYSALVVDFNENQFLELLNQENRAFLENPGIWLSALPGNTQAFDRYAYAFNNPIRYVDPNGHNPIALALAFIGPVGWVVLGILTVGTVIYFAAGGPEAIANSLAPSIDSLSNLSFAGKAGGANQAAQHLSMLLGGASVAGFGSHPGMPDPDGRDKKHNVEGLRNTLKSIQSNMRNGETIEDFLTRENWTPTQIRDFTSALQDYINNVLPTDTQFYGIGQDLADDIINLASKIGIK
jgi:RHS repeat-associated protein